MALCSRWRFTQPRLKLEGWNGSVYEFVALRASWRLCQARLVFQKYEKAISRDPGLLAAHQQGAYEMLYYSTPKILIAVASLHDGVVFLDWLDIDVLAFA